MGEYMSAVGFVHAWVCMCGGLIGVGMACMCICAYASHAFIHMQVMALKAQRVV